MTFLEMVKKLEELNILRKLVNDIKFYFIKLSIIRFCFSLLHFHIYMYQKKHPLIMVAR